MTDEQKAAATNMRRGDGRYYSKLAKKANTAWIKNGRKPRGLAAMSPERRREIARMGGKVSRRTKR